MYRINLKRHNFGEIVHIINYQIIFWQMPKSIRHTKIIKCNFIGTPLMETCCLTCQIVQDIIT